MPCYYTGSREGDMELSASAAEERAIEMTQNLCAAMSLLESHGLVTEMPDDVVEWWEDHKRVDAERIAEETEEAERVARSEAAMSKLTRQERIDLGLERE